MKIAIVYYSMSGNSELIAKAIAENLKSIHDVDTIRLEPTKAYPSEGAKKFIWGGKAAVMGEKPELKSYHFNEELYDVVIIGTPIWASNFAPPIRTFLNEHGNMKDKKIAAFMCYSGGGADKAMVKLKKYIGKKNFETELVLVDPTKNPNMDEIHSKIIDFCSALNRL